jgi:hypothetical protein
MRDLGTISGVTVIERGPDGAAFEVKYHGSKLLVLASYGFGWDHISVSLKHRCPNWPEMEHVKRMFFLDHETVMQLHVPTEEHINNHPYCLHLWRPHNVEIPRPPALMVGLK